MAEKRRFFDVWIVEINKVYKEVPFTVVGDWIQQGRLLETDQVRPSGTAEWLPLPKVELLAPYLPKPVPFRTEDQAEALEPVELDFVWKRPAEDEDDDVDMIPLIDISLVLLIFFMMTAGTLISLSLIPTPETDSTKTLSRGPNNITLGLMYQDRQLQYFVGDQTTDPMTEQQLLEEVGRMLKQSPGGLNVVVKAAEDVPFEKVRQLTMGLEKRGVKVIYAGVRDKPGGD
jgi:biopolymer transport protein ExbD